jgi:hypothetical protein
MRCADRVAIRDINEAVRLAHRDNCMEAMNRAESNLRGSMWLACRTELCIRRVGSGR